jgi:hypothetical protein
MNEVAVLLVVLALLMVVIGMPVSFIISVFTKDAKRTREMAAQWRELWPAEEEPASSRLLRPVDGDSGDVLLRPTLGDSSDDGERLLRPER